MLHSGDMYETEPDQKDSNSDMKKVGVQSSAKSKTQKVYNTQDVYDATFTRRV